MAATAGVEGGGVDGEGGGRTGTGRLVVLQMACGSLARASAAVLLIPLDTCKTRLQFQGVMSDNVVRRYEGLWDAFKTIWREEGVLAFYRGLPPRLLYIGPAAGISFAMYEWFKRSLAHVREGTGDRFEPVIPLIAGGGGRVLATAFKIPFDVVKQRLEVQGALRLKTEQNAYSGTWDAFRKIFTNEGIRTGLWRGFWVTLMRDVPFAATYFTTYELAKHTQSKLLLARIPTGESPTLGTLNHLAAGAWAGVAASTVTIPLDGIKTRIQTDRLVDRELHSKRREGAGAVAPADKLVAAANAVAAKGGQTASQPLATGRRARGILGTASVIFREEGVPGFFRGLPPRLFSVVPSSSITFAAYEVFKRLLGA